MLETYSKKWGFSNQHPLTKTLTSTLYIVNHKNNKAVFKLYTDIGKKFESQGPLFLKASDGFGAVKLYEYDENACLIEYADGSDLKSIVDKGEDKKATEILATIIKKTHSKCPLVSKNDGYQLFYDYIAPLYHEGKKENCPPIINKAVTFAKEILEDTEKYLYLHGDIQHENIINSSDRGWLLIDPKYIVAPPEYDTATCFINPLNSPLTHNIHDIIRRASQLSDIIGYNADKILKIACVRAALSSTWEKNNNGHHIQNRLKTAEIIAKEILDK